MIVDYSTDLRDGYHGQCGINAGSEDYVYVPDQTGTPFQVSFVEVAHFGLSTVHKRVYLKRLTPNWPTNDL